MTWLRTSWRVPASVAVLALLGWVGFEIGRAGNDIQVARTTTPDTLLHGRVEGKRIDGRAWSLDYDSVTMSPDGSQVTIAHVRDGRLHRAGKPDVLMKADGVHLNTLTNDLSVDGPVTFTERLGSRTRAFQTIGALYSGTTKDLRLERTATITEDGAKVVVSKATVNFRTGEVKLGRIEGTK
jgi:hypothetical protein